MKIKDVQWYERETSKSHTFVYKFKDLGTITVIERMFNGKRDVETGFRALAKDGGQFWLVSYQNFDIRDHPDFTIFKAIELIKREDNNGTVRYMERSS